MTLMVGLQDARRASDAAAEGAAAERDEDRIDIGEILQDLERNHAVAGQGCGFTRGIDIKSMRFVVNTRCDRAPPVVEGQLHDLRAESAQMIELGLRRVLRDHGGCGYSKPPGHPRYGDRAVARARGMNPLREGRRRLRQYSIADRAQLEGADRLHVFELEVNLPAGRCILRSHERGAQRYAGEPRARAFDISHGNTFDSVMHGVAVQ